MISRPAVAMAGLMPKNRFRRSAHIGLVDYYDGAVVAIQKRTTMLSWPCARHILADANYFLLRKTV